MAILKQKNKIGQRSISVRIPADVHSELEALRTDADAAGFCFSVSDVVTEALTKAVRQARGELSTVAQQTPHQSALQNVIQTADSGSAKTAGSFASS